YFLLNANRRSGLLMRKIETICNTMGITRDTAQRWLRILRQGGYIKTVNTGRSLTIQVTRWKPLAGAGRSRYPMPGIPNISHEKYPTSRMGPIAVPPLGYKAAPVGAPPGNDTIMKKIITNDM